MAPPTVPMTDVDEPQLPDETPTTSATTEAGKVSTVDDKGPKVCAGDGPAASCDGKAERDS